MANEEEGCKSLYDILSTKVVLEFVDGFGIGIDPKSYDKDDRSLDGMNALHLASKYYPEAITIILNVLNDFPAAIEDTQMQQLLHEKDWHLQQTPLHVAVKNSGTTAAR